MDRAKKISYYKELGLTDAQSTVLGSVEYSDHYIRLAVQAYYKSSDCHDKIPFCESIVKFAHEEDITEEILIKYIKKHAKNLLKEHGEFGGFKAVGFGSANFFGQSGGFLKKSIAPASFNNSLAEMDELDDFDEEEAVADIDYDGEFDCGVDNVSYDYVESSVEEDDIFGSGFSLDDLSEESCNKQESRCMSVNSMDNFIDSIRADKFEHIEEKGFRNVLSDPTSTFRTTCNNVSLDIIKNDIKKGLKINKSMVRIEELLNYFNYYLTNNTDKRFNIHAELCNKPFSENKLLYVGIKGIEKIPDKKNIVVLLDVSGSMGNNQVQTQAAIMTIVSKLNKDDKFSLVTYSDEDNTVIDSITINDNSTDFIIEQLLQVDICGCTYGSKGLNAAYDLINKNKIDDGINRVVVITDGDFNFGDCNLDSVEKLILEKKKTGATLSIIGTGFINTNDALMNTLAKNGNGNYCYIGNIGDVRENVNNKFNQLMFSIAKDVKAQIEFNPKYVKNYRLIGYENREISHSDFKNDKVIAEPFGSGAHAVAIYELEMTDNEEVKSDLKFQKPVLTESKDICSVTVRYKELDSDASSEIESSIEYKEDTVDNISYNMKLAYIIYILGEKLRKSDFINKKDIKSAKVYLEDIKDNYDINKDKLEIIEELFRQ